MKLALSILLTFPLFYLYSQDCDFDYNTGTVVYIPKKLIQTDQQKHITQKKILKLKECLNLSVKSEELYWLHNTIANKSFLVGDKETATMYSKKAFEIDKVTFCKEYISLHVSASDKDFPFKEHFFDSEEVMDTDDIKQYCIKHYKEKELKENKNSAETKLKEKSAKSIVSNYLIGLENISKMDQLERKKSTINWNEQNRLDSLNRIELDRLYKDYGFPSKEKVTQEGTVNAFMVLHHSTDCEWNEKWTERFLEHNNEINIEHLFSFYFYRNFNPKDGMCRDNFDFIENLKTSKHAELVETFFNFERWDKKFGN